MPADHDDRDEIDDTGDEPVVIDPETFRVFTPGEEDESEETLLDQQNAFLIPQAPDIEPILETLARGERAPRDILAFSDLDKENATLLARRWEDIPSELRLSLVQEAIELAIDDVFLLMSRFFRIVSHDSDASVRQIAAQAMASEEDFENRDRLLEMLAEDTSDDVRGAAAGALGYFAELEAVFDTDGTDDPDDPYAFLNREPFSGDSPLMQTLLRVAEDEDEPWVVRAHAVEAASIYTPNSRVDALVQRLYDEDELGLRVSAIFAMGRGNLTSWLPVIMKAFEDDDEAIRVEAIRAAGKMGEVEALPLLAEIARKDRDIEIRHNAIMAIGTIGGDAAHRTLSRIQEKAREEDLEIIEAALMEAVMASPTMSAEFFGDDDWDDDPRDDWDEETDNE